MYENPRKTTLSSVYSSIPNNKTDMPCVDEPKNAMLIALNLCPIRLYIVAVKNPESFRIPNTSPDCDNSAPLFSASFG